jgi:hypothetical protein
MFETKKLQLDLKELQYLKYVVVLKIEALEVDNTNPQNCDAIAEHSNILKKINRLIEQLTLEI